MKKLTIILANGDKVEYSSAQHEFTGNYLIIHTMESMNVYSLINIKKILKS